MSIEDILASVILGEPPDCPRCEKPMLVIDMLCERCQSRASRSCLSINFIGGRYTFDVPGLDESITVPIIKIYCNNCKEELPIGMFRGIIPKGILEDKMDESFGRPAVRRRRKKPDPIPRQDYCTTPHSNCNGVCVGVLGNRKDTFKWGHLSFCNEFKPKENIYPMGPDFDPLKPELIHGALAIVEDPQMPPDHDKKKKKKRGFFWRIND